MTDRELLAQALEALELLAWYENPATKVQVRKPRNGGPIVTMYPHKVATEAAAPLRERLAQPEQERKHDYRTRYDRGCYKCGSHYCPADCHELAHLVPQQPEQSPLDRMAENARELGLDYEPAQKEKPDGLQTTGPLTDRTDHVRNGDDYMPEPVAMRYDFDGYGYRYIDSGSGSNWQTRIKDAEPLYAAPQQSDTKVNFEAIPEQISEPVAWQWLDTGTFRKSLPSSAEPGAWNPLYTTPPRREWVGLTEEEIEQVCVPLGAAMLSFPEVARAIEAKLREKNGRVDSFLRRLLDPEDLGHAVSHEVRQKVRELL